MKIATYIVAHDGGFSPNPFHGWLTLACCKPAIRRTAKPDDWILGITPRRLGNKLAFAMQVGETLSFADYWKDERFRLKRPRWSLKNPLAFRRGDNCFRPLGGDRYLQQPCCHWDSTKPRERTPVNSRDLRGRHVLVAKRCSYFGANAREIPERLQS